MDGEAVQLVQSGKVKMAQLDIHRGEAYLGMQVVSSLFTIPDSLLIILFGFL
jgi:hypothetical protein